jgi:hypothetical protein
MLGTYEPNEEECEWPSDSEDEETELSDGVKEKVLVKETVARDFSRVSDPGCLSRILIFFHPVSDIKIVVGDPDPQHWLSVSRATTYQGIYCVIGYGVNVLHAFRQTPMFDTLFFVIFVSPTTVVTLPVLLNARIPRNTAYVYMLAYWREKFPVSLFVL